MNCYYHLEAPAVAQCHICHKGFCKDCVDEFSEYRLNNAPCCPDCFARTRQQEAMIAYQQHEYEYKKYRSQVLRYLLMIIVAIIFQLSIDVGQSEYSFGEFVYFTLMLALAFSSIIAGFDLEKALRRPSAYVVDEETGHQRAVYGRRGIIGILILGILLGSFVGVYYVVYVVCYKYPSLLIKRIKSKKKLVSHNM